MNHEYVLNLLLSNTCPATPGKISESNIYCLDLCCQDAEVTATPLGDGKYKIHGVIFK